MTPQSEPADKFDSPSIARFLLNERFHKRAKTNNKTMNSRANETGLDWPSRDKESLGKLLINETQSVSRMTT